MKPSIIIALFTFCTIACKEEAPIVKLNTTGNNQTIFIAPSSKFKISMNQPVGIRTTGGTAIQDLKDTIVFTAPNVSGVYSMIAKNNRDLQDSLVFKIVVTPRAVVFKSLQSGGYSLIFRHASADVGADLTGSAVPNWWKMCDASLARQLNEQGKKDAQKIGSVLKLGQIPIERVFSSEFCRCVTTADLMGLGKTIQTSTAITYSIYDEANRYDNTMKLANSQPIDDKNTILIIHAGFSGTLPNPAPLTTLEWGDAAVFKLGSGQSSTYITTLKVTDFTELIK
jgi:phosphohistidine phosphatase SixA